MAQSVDMANWEARLTTLGSQVEYLAQILQIRPGNPSEESITEESLDELNDFTADIKQARTQLNSFSQRWHDATVVKSEDVRRLEKREEEIEMKEGLLDQRTAEIEELLKQRAADIAEREELLEQKTRAINEREEIVRSREETLVHDHESLERRQQEFSQLLQQITTLRSGASSPAPNPTPATRQDLTVNPSPDTIVPPGQGDASLLNNNTAKRGLGRSLPENPPTKRPRFIRGGSVGATELLVNTTQTFGSPNERRRPLFETPRTTSGGSDLLTPFTGPIPALRSGVSSLALNPTSATRQDLTVNLSPNTIVPPGQGDDLATDLSMASDHVRDAWRQIEFPADWTTADSAKLLVMFNQAKNRRGGKNNRHWPQQAMDTGSKCTQPYCLTNDMKRLGMMAPQDGQRCESHAPGTLCIDVFYSSESPEEYDSTATDKRWRLEKRQ